MSKTALKYKILRVRAKVSYEAFINKMTIAEIFLNQILKSFNLFE
jgi:hypothetical protein